ncbi:MAG: TrmH family RNA methyltransferase [Bacteroidales bacterium]
MVKAPELDRISQLKTPNQVVGVFEIPVEPQIPKIEIEDLTLVLDDIGDPGNMGTIIRTADWFGIKEIICSENCVDIYNPKVVQSTMGSSGPC